MKVIEMKQPPMRYISRPRAIIEADETLYPDVVIDEDPYDCLVHFIKGFKIPLSLTVIAREVVVISDNGMRFVLKKLRRPAGEVLITEENLPFYLNRKELFVRKRIVFMEKDLDKITERYKKWLYVHLNYEAID